MSKYTIELRHLFEPLYYKPSLFKREEIEAFFSDYELTDYLTNEQIKTIENAGIWSKEKLAKKIVDHYYMREIGFETPALFRHYAKVEMNELMEYYLPLIYSSAIKYDPLVNVDFTETFERTADATGNSNSTSQSNSSNIGVQSDTPQGQIAKEKILKGDYASSVGAGETESDVSSNTESKSQNQEQYSKRVKGNSGVSATAQKMVEQYRQNIIAIDKEIIEKLNILFMGLY